MLIIKPRLFSCFALIAVFAVYSYSLIYDFGIHNDYRSLDHIVNLFNIENLRALMWHDESMHLLYIGRPINAILFNIQQTLLKNLIDFKAWRLISLVTLVLSTYYYFIVTANYIKTKNILLCSMFLLSAIVPSSMLYINWVTNFVPGTVNLLLSAIAWKLIITVIETNNSLTRKFAITLSVLLILIGNFIYPASINYVLFGAFVVTLLTHSREKLQAPILAIILSIICLSIYYALHKFYFFDFFQMYFGESFKGFDTSTYNFELSFNIDIFNRVYDAIVATFTGLFFTFPLEYTIAPVILVIALGLFLSCVMENFLMRPISTNDYASISLRSCIAASILFISIIPIAFSTNGFVAYRLLPLLCASAASLLAFSVYKNLTVFRILFGWNHKAIFCIFVAVICTIGFLNNQRYTENSKYEYEYIKKVISKAIASENNVDYKIYIIMDQRHKSTNGSTLPFDMVYTATNHSGLMSSIVHFIMSEFGVSRNKYSIKGLNESYREDYKYDISDFSCAGCILVDMKKIDGYNASK